MAFDVTDLTHCHKKDLIVKIICPKAALYSLEREGGKNCGVLSIAIFAWAVIVLIENIESQI